MQLYFTMNSMNNNINHHFQN